MSPKLTDPPPRPPANSHAPTVMDAFANAVTRTREVMAAHPDWTPEQIRAKVASYPDTVEPPAPPMSAAQILERARSASASRYDPDADVPCCPREPVGGGFNSPPCACQRLYR